MKKTLSVLLVFALCSLFFASFQVPRAQSATPGAAMFSVTGFPNPTVAGVAHNVTVTAKNTSGITVTGYTGTVKITSSDAQAVLPANAALTNGVGSFTVVLKTAGSNLITATDSVNSSITGAQNGITVNAAAVSNVIISPATDSIRVGDAETYTATASDAFGNSWDVTASTSWNISDGAGGSWSGNVYTSEVDGSWTVYGTYGSNVYAAGLTVIPLWSISLSPNQGQAGSTVDLSGTGFAASSSVTVTFGDSEVLSTFADPSGGVGGEFVVPFVSADVYVVNATDDTGGSATTTFTITAAMGGTSGGPSSSGSTSTSTTTTTTTTTTQTSTTSTTPNNSPTPTPKPYTNPTGSGGTQTSQPTSTPTPANNGLWSPLTIGIIAVVLVAFFVPAFMLYARQGKRRYLEEDRRYRTPKYPSAPSGPTVATQNTQVPYQSRQAASTFATSRYSQPSRYSSSYSQQRPRAYGATRPYQQSYSRPTAFAKTCPYCKRTVRDGMSVCPSCGKRLR